ncbi:MAG: hypothetical protein J6E42_09075 [Firmicutes bacterium]|nr:hypothetical protein [Bacillota bacterium]
MLAAEKWYAYQENYQKYGLDMRPAEEKKIRERTEKDAAISVTDKLRLLVLIIMLGALFVGFVAATAYGSKIQYNINTIQAKSAEVQGEIENLNVKIKSATNIQTIEEKALAMGMVYPKVNEYVYINGEKEEPVRDFALALMEQAYN